MRLSVEEIKRHFSLCSSWLETFCISGKGTGLKVDNISSQYLFTERFEQALFVLETLWVSLRAVSHIFIVKIVIDIAFIIAISIQGFVIVLESVIRFIVGIKKVFDTEAEQIVHRLLCFGRFL